MILVSHKELAAGNRNVIEVYDMDTAKCLYALKGHTGQIEDLIILEDG